MNATTIYNEIIKINEIDPVDEESYIRNLRNKMSFVIEHIALRKVSDFKQGKRVVIPDNDAPIVCNLIMAALDRENFPFISDWFNGSLNLSDAQTCQWLFMSIGEPIMRAEMSGETDRVTVDEWISVIRGVLNVDMAGNTIRMKNKLEEFRTRTLVINSTVSMGDVIVTHYDGSRSYGLKGEHRQKLLPEETLKLIVGDLYHQNDYFDVLGQILDYMVNDAERKAIPAIEAYAAAKSLSECESAVEMIDADSMVSEYYPWFKKIAVFLHNHPDETQRVERLTGTNNLEKFFA